MVDGTDIRIHVELVLLRVLRACIFHLVLLLALTEALNIAFWLFLHLPRGFIAGGGFQAFKGSLLIELPCRFYAQEAFA